MGVEQLRSDNPPVSDLLVKLAGFLDANAMTTEAVQNRNFFPVGAGVSATGENVLFNVGDEEIGPDFSTPTIKAYAAQGAIVVSALAVLAQTEPEGGQPALPCVLMVLDDAAGRRFTYHRPFRVEGDRCLFDSPIINDKGQSPVFGAAA